MDEIIKVAVEEYQCPGCVCGSDTTCYVKVDDADEESCEKHVCGTILSGIGHIFLGMPRGFNRRGLCEDTKIHIFRRLKNGWNYDHLNVPVWKYKDHYGNTLVRGLCPRINYPWIHIFLDDCLSEINCIEITDNDLDDMS